MKPGILVPMTARMVKGEVCVSKVLENNEYLVSKDAESDGESPAPPLHEREEALEDLLRVHVERYREEKYESVDYGFGAELYISVSS